MARSRTNRSPALAASAALHAAVIAAALMSWAWGAKHLTMGQIVPVEIVNGPPADMAPAIQAPEPSPAKTEQPTPAPTPPTPVATPAPTPTPPAPQPKQAVQPMPRPTPAPGKPTGTAAAKPAPGQGKPAKGLDLSALAASLPRSKAASKPTKSLDLSALAASIAKPGQGEKGASHPRTAPQAATGQGAEDHLSASDVNGLVTKLQRLWNPNCDVEGAAGINVKVRIRFNHDGTLAAPPELVDRSIDPSSGGLLGASAHRALSAVVRGAPYTELPADAYGDWKVMTVNFNAKQACSRR